MNCAATQEKCGVIYQKVSEKCENDLLKQSEFCDILYL